MQTLCCRYGKLYKIGDNHPNSDDLSHEQLLLMNNYLFKLLARVNSYFLIYMTGTTVTVVVAALTSPIPAKPPAAVGSAPQLPACRVCTLSASFLKGCQKVGYRNYIRE